MADPRPLDMRIIALNMFQDWERVAEKQLSEGDVSQILELAKVNYKHMSQFYEGTEYDKAYDALQRGFTEWKRGNDPLEFNRQFNRSWPVYVYLSNPGG